MVEFQRYMSIALEKCAPSGDGSGDERQAHFAVFVDLWNEEKGVIKQATEAELREMIDCPSEADLRDAK